MLFDQRPGKPDRGRLGRVLRRALAERPGDRYPSITSLVDRLEAAARPRWPRYVTAGSIAIAVVLGGLWWREHVQAGSATCAADGTVGGTWNTARRAELAMAITARDRSPGHTLATSISTLIERRARAWSDAVVDVCDARARGTLSAQVVDGRGACLEDRRRELDAVLSAIQDTSTPLQALAAVARLAPAATCSALQGAPVTTGDGARRHARDELIAVAALQSAGRYADASVRLEAFAKSAPADIASVAASIAVRRADLMMRRDPQAALSLAHDAVTVAERAHEGPARVRALVVLVKILDDLGRTTETNAVVPLLEAAAASEKLDDAEVTDVENALGSASQTAGDYAAAERHYRAALAALDREYGDVPAYQIAGLLSNLGSVLHTEAKTEAARATLLRSLAMFEHTVGADHADVALPLMELGALAFDANDQESAATYVTRAIAVRTAALGAEHPYLCESLGLLGRIERARGHDDRALELFRRALAIAKHGFGAEHPLVAVTEGHLAEVLEARGEHAEARAMVEAAVKIWDASGTSLPEAHNARFELARYLWADGAHDRARVLAEVARAWGLRRTRRRTTSALR